VIGAIVAGVLILRYGPDFRVTDVAVAPTAPVTPACDIVVQLTGTLHTSGRGGTVSYEWRRNDGRTTGPLTQVVPPGRHTVTVSMAWTVKGVGVYDGSATLVVLAPTPAQASAGFTYQCAG
jgi:hypothetical protein